MEEHNKPPPRSFNFLASTELKASIGGAVLLSWVFGLQSYYPDYIGPLSNIFPALVATSAFIAALWCSRRYGFSFRLNFEAVWVLYALGIALWAVAEATWAFYYFVLNIQVPYPSAADIFYVGGYFPVIGASVLYVFNFRVALSRKRLLAAIGGITIAVILALAFVIPAELSTAEPLLNYFIDLLYPILDLTLLSVSILAVVIFYGGRIAKWWVLFGLGALLYVIGDEYFLLQAAQGTYYNGGLDDLIFLLGYIAFALAFTTHRKEF